MMKQAHEQMMQGKNGTKRMAGLKLKNQ
jgi:hypothetical protein